MLRRAGPVRVIRAAAARSAADRRPRLIRRVIHRPAQRLAWCPDRQPERHHQAEHHDARDDEQDGRGGHLRAHPATARRQAAAALRSGVLTEPVTRRQPQARAGQVVRADRTAPYAVPRQQLTSPPRRDLRPFPGRHGIRNPVRGRRPGHWARPCLTPLRNSASTSARRYRGFPASLRTSGSRPRRAQLATAAEVTRNKDATCLRVIRSSPMRLPVASRSSGSPVGRNELIRDSAGHPARLLPGKAQARYRTARCPLH